MCGLCGLLGPDLHWSDPLGDDLPRRRERLRRVAAINRVVAPFRLTVSDVQGASYLIQGPSIMSLAVNVITGFLGSGKTTLLRRLLAQEALGETALLINEFGEVGIDHLLVEEVAPDTVLLPSGCVCCSVRGDLKAALLTLHGRRSRGEIPAFRRVLLETTGLADPGPILATLTLDPQLRGRFHLGLLVTVVKGCTRNGSTRSPRPTGCC